MSGQTNYFVTPASVGPLFVLLPEKINATHKLKQTLCFTSLWMGVEEVCKKASICFVAESFLLLITQHNFSLTFDCGCISTPLPSALSFKRPSHVCGGCWLSAVSTAASLTADTAAPSTADTTASSTVDKVLWWCDTYCHITILQYNTR